MSLHTVPTSLPSTPARPAGPPSATDLAPAASARGLNRRRSLMLGLVGMVLLVVIFVRVIPVIGSYSGAATALGDMTPMAVGLISVAVLAYLAAYGLPFVAAVPGLRFWQGQQVNQAAFTVGNGLPAGGAVGLGVQYTMLAGYGVEQAAGTAAIVSIGVWSTFVTLGVPVLGVAAIQLSGHGSGGYLVPAAATLAVLVAAVAGFALAIRRESAARTVGLLGNRILGPILRRSRRTRDLDLVPAAIGFRASLADLVRRRWAVITAAQLGVLLAQFVVFYTALRGAQDWSGAGASVLVAFGAFAVAQLGLLIPLTPGGLGTVDSALISLLVAMGVPAGQATAADLVWRGASFVPQIVVGAAALLAWSRSATRAVGAGRRTAPGQPLGLAATTG